MFMFTAIVHIFIYGSAEDHLRVRDFVCCVYLLVVFGWYQIFVLSVFLTYSPFPFSILSSVSIDRKLSIFIHIIYKNKELWYVFYDNRKGNVRDCAWYSCKEDKIVQSVELSSWAGMSVTANSSLLMHVSLSYCLVSFVIYFDIGLGSHFF